MSRDTNCQRERILLNNSIVDMGRVLAMQPPEKVWKKSYPVALTGKIKNQLLL